MRVAEMEAKHNTRPPAPPKRYHKCKSCGREITQKAKLCRACQEMDVCITSAAIEVAQENSLGVDRICKYGHPSIVGMDCAICKSEHNRRRRQEKAEKLAKKRKAELFCEK